MTTTKFIEYEDDTKQLAQVLYDLLRDNALILECLENNKTWAKLSTYEQHEMYALTDDFLEEAANVGEYDDIDDDDEDWEL